MATFTGLDGTVNFFDGTPGGDTFVGGANGAFNSFAGEGGTTPRLRGFEE